MTKSPYEQGALDSLCGVYSIVNAARIVGRMGDEESKELFRNIIVYMGHQGMLGRILVGGLTLHAIDLILRHIDGHFLTYRSRPFRRAPETPLDRFWAEMIAFLEGEPDRAILLGMGGVYDHWTVVGGISDRQIRLSDSYGLKTLNRNRCTTLRPTSRRPHQLYPTHTFFLA